MQDAASNGYVRAPAGFEGFSPRETEVLQLIAEGKTNTQIALGLGVTVHTVKFHLASIYRKLGVQNRTEAVVAFLSDAR